MAWVAGFDVAQGGRRGDRIGAAVARPAGRGAVLDAVRVYTPPFSPSAVIAEVAGWFKTYGITEVHGDRVAEGFVVQDFKMHGLTYRPCALDRSQLYLELLALVNSGRVRLLDHPELLRELRGLERRRGGQGRDRVDHRRGNHDDLANAVATALVLAAGRSRNELYTGLSAGEFAALVPSSIPTGDVPAPPPLVLPPGGVYWPGG